MYQSRIESIESSTERMKHALTCCFERAHVEPDRRVEAEHLVQQHPGQLVVEDFGVLGGGEVAVLLAGPAVGADHPVDELAQAGLPLRRADRAAEVLGGHDVGRVETPEVRELHAPLLEVDRAVAPVRHHDVAPLPGHLVVGMHAFGRPDAFEPQAGRRPATRPFADSPAPEGVPTARVMPISLVPPRRHRRCRFRRLTALCRFAVPFRCAVSLCRFAVPFRGSRFAPRRVQLPLTATTDRFVVPAPTGSDRFFGRGAAPGSSPAL